MAKYARLFRVRLTRDGYIMKGDPLRDCYRGTPDDLYRCCVDDTYDYGQWMEFRGKNRATVVIKARKWLAQNHPGFDVRS